MKKNILKLIRTFFAICGLIAIVFVVIVILIRIYNDRTDILPIIRSKLKSTPTVEFTKNNTSGLDEKKLFNLINDWEKQQGYSPYIENSKLCEAADERLSILKIEWSTSRLNDLVTKYGFDISENSAKDFHNEQYVLNSWLATRTTKKNLTDYNKYSCVKCDGTYCVQLVSNMYSTNQNLPVNNNFDVNNQNNIDPLVNCSMHTNCGGGTRLLNQSVCDQSVCCQVGGGWYFYTDKNKCFQDQKSNINTQNTNTTNNNYIRPTTSTYIYPTNPPQNNNPQPTSTTYVYPTTASQITNPQPTVNNTAARDQCFKNVRENLESGKLYNRTHCRVTGCDSTPLNELLTNEANTKIEQCKTMYP